MKDTLLNLLSGSVGNDYCDIRYDDRNVIAIRGNLSNINIKRWKNAGFHKRVYHGGRWKSQVFSHPDVHFKTQSKPNQKSIAHRIEFIPGKLQKTIKDRADNTLSSTTCEQKVNLIHNYLGLVKSYDKVCAATIYYREENCLKYFLNCKERYISQEQEHAICIIDIVVDTGHGTRSGTEVLNSRGSFDSLLNGQRKIENLLSFLAKSVSNCSFLHEPLTVICSPQLSGSLVHEAIGHALEADYKPHSMAVREKLQPGTRSLSPLLTVIDNPGLRKRAGHYLYDDEGVEATKKILVANGQIIQKMHNLSTAFLNQVPSTGNGRAVGYQYFPIVRMSNLYAKAGKHSLREMIESTKKGLLLRGLRGGRVFGDRFLYQVNGGNIIEQGQLKQSIGNLLLENEILDFLRNITMVGKRVSTDFSASCIKEGQAFLPLWNGAPYLKIDNVKVKPIQAT